MQLKKNYVRSLVFIFISLFLISSISAQPPFIQPTQSFINGYIIEIPEQGILKANQDFNFFFHVFNISNGLPLTDDVVNCEFNLHDSTSRLIFSDNSLFFDDTTTAFNVTIQGGNFTPQDYTYVTHCNSTSFGGFTSVEIEVTPSGRILSEGEGTVLFGIMIFLILIVVFFLVATIFINNLPFKIFLGSLSVLILIGTLGFGLTIMQQILGGFSNVLSSYGTFYRLFIILLGGAAAGLILFLVAFALTAFNRSRGTIE